MTPEEAIAVIEKTVKFHFGKDPEADYKRFKLLLHPDRFGRDEAMAKRALAATLKLDTLYAKVSGKPASSTPVKLGEWIVTEPIAKGDIADLYRAESDLILTAGVLKIARSARDNDLIKTEFEALKPLRGEPDKRHHFANYLPPILDNFTASGRAANVLGVADGFITLSEIQKLVRLDFRHVVWMMNRALSVLGYVHRAGFVHGAINSDHLMYKADDHNLCLVDWCYSVFVPKGNPIKAIVKEHRADYPPEVLRKRVPGPGTDLYMLAKALSVGVDIPKRFRPLFDLCMLASPSSRPADAWAFQDKWKAVAEQEYGPPQFVPLRLPVQ